METQKKIRVLVVDDSPLSREMIVRGLSGDPLLEVVATAANPFEASDKILKARPDVLTCDVEMPQMNGIEFVRRLLPQHFVPVVMVSAVSDAVFEAMEAGAVDFVVKPEVKSNRGMVEVFLRDLCAKIKIASHVRPRLQRFGDSAGKVKGDMAASVRNIIAIGASTGGTEAIFHLLSALPPTVPGIVIVQHIPPVFSRMFADRLNSSTALAVKEAETGDFADPGRVLIAPGDRHLKISKVGGRYKAECFLGDKVNGHCPSVDVLFESVASVAASAAVGILLTGMGYDGAKGLLSIRRKGGRTVGQDETSSVVYGMPKVAFNMGAVETQAALGDIPQILFHMLG